MKFILDNIPNNQIINKDNFSYNRIEINKKLVIASHKTKDEIYNNKMHFEDINKEQK